jgi:xanthine dehydrogenase accessory factor
MTIILGYGTDDLRQCHWSEQTYVLVTTHDHSMDQQLTEYALQQKTAYVGLIGSQRKALFTRERLKNKNFSEETIARLHCPVGLSIHAETPAEIALAVLAQITQYRRQMM